MDHSYSSGRPHNYFMLELQHQVEFPENSGIVRTGYSYCFFSLAELLRNYSRKMGPF